jgi:hypothetical protein
MSCPSYNRMCDNFPAEDFWRFFVQIGAMQNHSAMILRYIHVIGKIRNHVIFSLVNAAGYLYIFFGGATMCWSLL